MKDENIGKKYQHLTIIRCIKPPAIYECLCECGKTINAYISILKHGTIRSCGCMYHYRGVKNIGFLTIVNTIKKDGSYKLLCKCICGKKFLRVKPNLKKYNYSCGCKRNARGTYEYKKEYVSWTGMKARCLNSNAHKYCDYGGRGIKVCDRWLGKEGFKNFLEDMGKRPKGMSLDRYPDKNGNYEPSNCRWATQKEQCNNTRATRMVTYNNETLPLTTICEKYGFNYHSIRNKISNGLSFEKTINYKKKQRRKSGFYSKTLNNEFYVIQNLLKTLSVNEVSKKLNIKYNKIHYIKNKLISNKI